MTQSSQNLTIFFVIFVQFLNGSKTDNPQILMTKELNIVPDVFVGIFWRVFLNCNPNLLDGQLLQIIKYFIGKQ